MSETSKPFNPNLRTAIDTDVRPGTPAPAPAGEGHTPNPNKRKKTGLVVGAVAGIAGLALAGSAAVLGPRLLNGNGDNDPNAGNGPVPAATDDPGNGNNGEGQQPNGETLPTVESFEIPAGLSTEEVSKLILERITATRQAGITPDAIQRWTYLTGGIETNNNFILNIVDQTQPIYQEGLFTDDADLTNIDLRQGQINELTAAFSTSNPDYDDKMYEGSYEYNGSADVNQEGNERTITIDYTVRNNADQNRVGEGIADFLADDDGNTARFTVTLRDMGDGTEKISFITVESR